MSGSPHDGVRVEVTYSVTFSLRRLQKTNDLKPPGLAATFLFCNILPPETSPRATSARR
jgi:hypothetical protein